MYFLRKFIFFVLFFLISTNIVYSNEKVFFIDLDLIIQKTNYGKKILDNLNKINEENITKLKIKENELRSSEEEIKKKQTGIIKEKILSSFDRSYQKKLYNTKRPIKKSLRILSF